MQKAFTLFFLIAFFICGNSQPILKPARIIFYNTENLFDTIHNPQENDEEFLPNSKLHWNTEKYKLKLDHISKVLAAMLDTIQPLVIGLAEVENGKAIEDLVNQPALKKFHFGIIHHDSPDARGIGVVLLYNKDLLGQPFDAYLRVKFPYDPGGKTRDIIYVNGHLNEDERIWIFVNHWPSRREGTNASEQKRLTAENVLRDKIENIYKGDPHARVIVMGDFNDNPVDESIEKLSAPFAGQYAREEELVNLMKPMFGKNEFTLKFGEQNEIFDQFIVSDNLLSNKNSYYIRHYNAHIFKPQWILYHHNKYGWIPNRTYSYDRWVKGYSDHLPVYMDVVFK